MRYLYRLFPIRRGVAVEDVVPRIDALESRVSALERQAIEDRSKLGGILQGIREDVAPLRTIIRDHGREVMAELKDERAARDVERDWWRRRVDTIEARILDLERRQLSDLGQE